MVKTERTYLPAAGHDWFLPLYDPVTRLLGVDATRKALLEQAALRVGHRVLDLGCGTGTLAILITRLYPDVEVTGLDPDPRALARARRKTGRAAAPIRFDRGFADALPYPDATFDRVFSSMMFHHLPPDQKDKALREVRRVLKPGGRLELVDFAEPDGHTHGLVGRLVHSHNRLRDNTDDRILDRLARAGFVITRMAGEKRLLFGRLGFFQAAVGEGEP